MKETEERTRITVTSKYGPNLMPVGIATIPTPFGTTDRPVAMTYAMSPHGDWYFTNEPRDYLPQSTLVDWSAV